MYILDLIFIAVIGTLVGFLIGMSGKPKNNVHFYVARDNSPIQKGMLNLWINKPSRGVDIWYAGKNWAIHIAVESNFEVFGLNSSNYNNLKWEDEPIEVFLNIEN